MSFWHKKQAGVVSLYQATTMAWLPGVVQGFTTRTGGVSTGSYDSLNLSLQCGDDSVAVEQNRALVSQAMGIALESFVFAEQVHGNRVEVVTTDSPRLISGADALVTGVRGVTLALLFADCYPVYFIEPHKKVIAIAHVGWRGLDSGVIRNTAEAMCTQFGVAVSSCQVAVGPGIAAESYEVGSEVADRFRESVASGATTAVMPRREMEGTWELNLRSIIFSQLLSLGFRPESISVCDTDTYANEREFFSFRRESKLDKPTGRMLGFIGLRTE